MFVIIQFEISSCYARLKASPAVRLTISFFRECYSVTLYRIISMKSESPPYISSFDTLSSKMLCPAI